jgi:hypothetical protein
MIGLTGATAFLREERSVEITVNTNQVAAFAKRQAKTYVKKIAVTFFSFGWLAALFAVLNIPADIVKRELYWENREIEAARKYQGAMKREEAWKGELDAAKQEAESLRAHQALRPQRQLESVGHFQIAAAILCVWLSLVVMFWAWKLYPVIFQPTE